MYLSNMKYALLNKYKRLLPLILLIFLFIQCTNPTKTTLRCKNNRWYQSEVLSLNYNNAKEGNSKSLYIDLSYLYGSQFSEIPLDVYIITPLHQIYKYPVVIELIDDQQNELGDCVGDYCDMKKVILENQIFSEKGIYKINVLNNFNNNYLPNIISVGIEIH